MDGFPIQSGSAGFAVKPPRTGYAVDAPGAMRSMRPEPDGEEKLREQVRQFVGGTVFGLMLKSMRRTVPKGGMFSGGRGEEVFRDVMDHELVTRMADSSNFKLVDAALRQLSTSKSDAVRGLRAYALNDGMPVAVPSPVSASDDGEDR